MRLLRVSDRRRIVAVIGVNALLSCGLLEIALRVQEPHLGLMSWTYYNSPNYRYAMIDHPVWHHQPRPNLSGLRLRVDRPVRSEELEYTLRTNSFGCRGEEPLVPRPAHRYRVIVMGDSFTEGYAEEDTVAHQLEQSLDARGLPIDFEVMNCGVSSFSMLTILLRLREQLLEAAPDALIVNVDLTDLYDDYWRRRPEARSDAEGRPLAAGREGDGEGPVEAFLLRHSFLARAVSSYGRLTRKLVKTWLEGAPDEVEMDPSMRRRYLDTLRDRYWPHSREPGAAEAFETGWAYSVDLLDRILALCEAQRLACAFTTYPHEAQLRGGDEPPPLHREFARRIAAHLEARGVFFYDAYDDIAAAYLRDPSIYFTGDMHFTPAGQRAWGSAFSAALSPWVLRAAAPGQSSTVTPSQPMKATPPSVLPPRQASTSSAPSPTSGTR